MVMDMTFMGENYFIINNHFKCCGDGNLDMNDEADEEKRRYNAVNFLKEYIDTYLSDKNVIVLGDLNDEIAESSQNNVFQNVLNDTENFFFVDYSIASGNSSDWSYPSWPSHLDHILVTNELFDELDNSVILTIKVDEYLAGGWNEYDYNISDHRPVAISFNLNSSISGDLNDDDSVDILDIVILVNHILSPAAVELEGADLNNDGEVNILDIVALVNIILET
jgi:predicted extracellular nuclease